MHVTFEGKQIRVNVDTFLGYHTNHTMMKIFEKLNKIRAYQRANLSFLESLEDYDIICEIGNAQEAGTFTTAKQLLLCQIGAPATLRRRLERMVNLGVVTKARNAQDGRMAELRLVPDVLKAYAKLGKHIEKLDKS